VDCLDGRNALVAANREGWCRIGENGVNVILWSSDATCLGTGFGTRGIRLQFYISLHNTFSHYCMLPNHAS